jgi:hypothetical protein
MGASNMNKSTTSAATTAFSRIRSLLAFRHHNPVARLVSVVLAFAIAMLLAVGSGAAYAGATDPSAATADSTVTDTPSDPTATPTPDASTDPSVTTPSDAPTDQSTVTSTTPADSSGTTTPVTGSPAKTSSVSNSLQSLAAVCPAANGTAHLIGDFEIDGNTCVNASGKVDWESLASSTHKVDGAKDATAYKQGDAENTAATGWHTGGSSQGKDDITDAYSYTDLVPNGDGTSDVWTYFGVTRVSDTGTTTYDVELNKKTNVSANPNQPNRSVRDLLLQFAVNGHGPLTFDKAYSWTAAANFGANCFASGATGFGWCPLDTVAYPNFVEGHSADGLFAEGALDLSALGRSNGGICTGNFGQMNIRTVASEQHTAALQDFVLPFDTKVDSTCGSIVIHKYADDGTTPAGGAHFTISPDPTPGSKNASLAVVDGGVGDSDGAANGTVTVSPAQAGKYSVQETVAPAGYLLPPADQQTVGPLPLADGAGETVVFNFTDPYQWSDLTVGNNATALYDSSYLWSIDKQVADSADGPWTDSAVDTDSQQVNTSTGSGTAYYQVTVTQGDKNTSNYRVTGSVSVKNPNTGRSVTVHLSAAIGATDCTFADSSPAVPGDNTSHSYSYDCELGNTPPSSLTGNNQATVTWSKTDYPQSQGDVGAGGTYSKTPTAVYDFTAAAAEQVRTNKTIHVSDTYAAGFTPNPQSITWTKKGATTVLSYSRSVDVATAGTCQAVDNTATITETLQSDSATATVCRGADLEVTKNATESLTRTYLWDISKTADQTNLVAAPDGTVTAHYSVRVQAKGFDDSNWVMTGEITVHNPNSWEPVTLTGIVDAYQGRPCVIDDSAGNLTLARDETRTYHYTCTFGSKPPYDGVNTATATWSSPTAHTPTGTASGTATVTDALWHKNAHNQTIDVYDDWTVPGEQHLIASGVDWSSTFDHTYQYSVDLSGVTAGTCKRFDNNAWILGDDADPLAQSSAFVRACNGQQLTVAKTASGHFDRTYHWGLTKSVSADPKSDPAGWGATDTWSGPSYSHLFGYRVVLSQLPWTDSNYTITGAITLTNPNSDATIPAIHSVITDTPALGTSASCVVTDDGADGSGDGQQLSNYTTPDIASGDSLVIGYECTLTGVTGAEEADGGTNSVSATNASDSPATAHVAFNRAGEFDKTVNVVDDKVDLATPETLNAESVTYDEGNPAATYHWDYQLTHTASEVACQDFTNHASVLAQSFNLFAPLVPPVTASTTATVCPQAGSWKVSKTNSPGDGPVPVDSDITYTLTAQKTGGVNPKGIVVSDDLTDIALHVTLPTQAQLDDAAPSGSTATISGNVITWTIDELGSTDETLAFTVHVNPDAYGVDLPNLVTSPGSDNCPDVESTDPACSTDNDTPHYTLKKSSDAGDQVMPRYLGAEGTVITYTLTVHNDSAAPINGTTMPGEKVTDDLTDVLDNAIWLDKITPDDGSAVRAGNTLTWTLPALAADDGAPGGPDEATLTYQVQVADNQWDASLVNHARPGDGGDCLTSIGLLAVTENPNCTTTTVTPPYAQITALKVDAETGAALDGAEFSLSTGGSVIATGVSGADGLVSFATKLQPGTFRVTETKAPTGYSLPVGGAFQDVTITADELDNGETPVQVTFRDPADGTLALAKAHQERSGGSWVPSDGQIAFNDQVRYVVTVTATGPKLFHDVTVTDYVPGYNPADSQTQLGGFKGVLDAGSIGCSGAFTCTSTYDAATGKIKWHLTGSGHAAGDVSNQSGTVDFVVRMPDLPRISPLAGPGVAFAGLMWNQAALGWGEFTSAGEGGDLSTHALLSNEVTDAANETLPPQVIVKPPTAPQKPHPHVLPNTGGPDGWVAAGGLALVLAGATLVLADQRRRRRS